MFANFRHTTATALVMVVSATLTVGLAAPAAHAQRSDIDAGHAHQATTSVTDVGNTVAYRKAQQAQYLVEHGLLAFR